MRWFMLVLSCSLFLSACIPTTQKATNQLTLPPTISTDNQQLTTNSMPNEIPASTTSAVIKTSLGDITIKLFGEAAPLTVNNFIGLATGTKTWTNPKTNQETSTPLYNNTIFHRVIDGFMIQGGDPLGTGTGGPGYRFQDEISPNLTFDRPYLLAMANAGPNTNGSQFFITVAPTPWLNGKHTIFGEVTAGQDVVDKIATTPTGAGDKPVTDVIIQQIIVE